jgi:hypothetical protein
MSATYLSALAAFWRVDIGWRDDFRGEVIAHISDVRFNGMSR